MDSKKLAQLCWEYADNKKAENIVILDVSKLSSVADYFVICSGTSEPHLRAISDEILNKLRDEQRKLALAERRSVPRGPSLFNPFTAAGGIISALFDPKDPW